MWWSFLFVQGTKDETEKEDESEKPETSAAPPSQQPPPPAQGKVYTPIELHIHAHTCHLSLCLYIQKEEKKTEADDKKEEEVVIEEMEIEEPSEPPRPSALSRMMTRFQEEVWPKSKWLFTFKIDRDGPVGIFLRLFGCLMAFLSCFTITYQVLKYLFANVTDFAHSHTCRLRFRTTKSSSG